MGNPLKMDVKKTVSDLENLKGDEGNLQESLNIFKDSYNKENPLISIVIPLYNEESSIKNVINRIPNHRKLEIIIVDDGSTDNSVRKIKEIENKDIKIIQHYKNQGYGAALISGIESATGEIIVTMDSDGQHNPEEIPNLIKPIIDNQADLVVGSRYLGKSHYKVPLHARVGEYIINICLSCLYRQKVRNNQSGFRAFDSQYVNIFKNMRDTKFGLCTETLFKAVHNKLRIYEIPISVNIREYGNSRVDLFKICISISFCILVYVVKRFKLNRLISNRILAKMKHKITILISKFT